MTQAATIDSTGLHAAAMNQLMDDLHGFINSVRRPKFLDSAWAEKTRHYSIELSSRVAELRGYMDEKRRSWSTSFAPALERMQESLHEYATELREGGNSRRLESLYRSLANDYEELLANLREHKIAEIKAVHLKPVNYARNVFHVSVGITCVLLYEFVLSRSLALWMMGVTLSIFGTLEITRRFSSRWNDFLVDKVFGIISRPHERTKINGSTYYLIAMFLLVVFFDKPIVELAVLVLGFADPAASVVGKLWGRRKLFKDKSFVGTFSFLAVAFGVSFGFLSIAVPAFSTSYALIVAAVVAVVSTAVELFSVRVDDNFSVPMAAALAAVWFF